MSTEHRERWPWYLVDLCIFWALVGTLLYLTGDYAWGPIRPWQFVIFGLAAWRIGDVAANEKVSEPIRVPLEQSKHPGLQTLGYVIGCPSCGTIWYATLLIFSWRVWPYETTLVAAIFALSACERFGAKVYNWLDKRD
jgi:hypothetical protein